MKTRHILFALIGISLFSIMIGSAMYQSELYELKGAHCTPINQSYVCVRGAK